MEQIPMRGMKLNRVEADRGSTFPRVAERLLDAVNPIAIERPRHSVVLTKRNLRGRHDVSPSAVGLSHQMCLMPRRSHAAFSPRMSQLYSGGRPVFMKERDDPTEPLNMIVRPYTHILRRDAALRQYSSCLGENEAGATDRSRCKMNEVPVVRETIHRGVLTHGRHNHAIGQRYVPQ
jgi:hypothetical protein